MNLKEYISTINRKFREGNATEHTYRGALEQLLHTLLPKLSIVNEPKREKCGAPDYITTRSDGIPVFYIEAKNIGDNDLDGRHSAGNKEQFDRYKQALDYIIFTDYLDFHLYKHGKFAESVRIAEVKGDKIVPVPESEDRFISFIENVGNNAIQKITSASGLARLMAGKARLLANIISRALMDETYTDANDNLSNQYLTFKEYLIQDLEPDDFADIYAQTIAYGMFAARLHDDIPTDFSREEAGRLIPRTNPFLRNLFNTVAGNELDERIAWVVDDLVTVFRATDLGLLMDSYTKNKRHHDPMIHFYEDFLSEYNPRMRKLKGVWYTPQPVVGFIVRAVDEILQKDFGLQDGLADYSTTEREVAIEQSRDRRTADGMKHRLKKFHRVQILDPATGTGTFLAEVVSLIYDRYRDNQGIWQQYVEQHLLPRLNGFEILMASYAVAHIKLDMLLHQTGYRHQTDKRLRIYLTNSLEESNNEPRTLFARWLSREATEANVIKRDSPVMVMIGNPPYSVSSQNKGEWINNLLADYKKDLKERNIQPLSDDYIKFIRLGQHYIDRNGEGVLAFICNNSFTDGIIHRQMRKELMRTFDKIFILDLHGNSRKKETTPDGSKDENVFDIMQGVSINIFVKTGMEAKEELGKVYHKDLYGLRGEKYNFLDDATIESVGYKEIAPKAPMFFFVPKDFSLQEEYERGFKIDELFEIHSTGITTCKDAVNYWNTEEEVLCMVNDILSMQESDFREKYHTGTDSRDWSIARAKEDVKTAQEKGNFEIAKIQYRQFDFKFVVYTGKTNGIVAWPRFRSLHHLLHPLNFSLIVPRQTSQDWRHVFVSQYITDMNILSSAKLLGAGVQFPLYNVGEADSIFGKGEELKPNFNGDVIKKIEQSLGEPVEPWLLFDYIYAVLHSPGYRERYKELLKIDFPRIPFPTDRDKYHQLVEKGTELRRLHLMQGMPNHTGVLFPISGSMQVECCQWKENRVYINSEQYFEGVPESAWNFYIGGYQPAQKFLKDRKGMILSFDDVKHYQHIVYILQQTDCLMQEIDILLQLN